MPFDVTKYFETDKAGFDPSKYFKPSAGMDFLNPKIPTEDIETREFVPMGRPNVPAQLGAVSDFMLGRDATVRENLATGQPRVLQTVKEALSPGAINETYNQLLGTTVERGMAPEVIRPTLNAALGAAKLPIMAPAVARDVISADVEDIKSVVRGEQPRAAAEMGGAIMEPLLHPTAENLADDPLGPLWPVLMALGVTSGVGSKMVKRPYGRAAYDVNEIRPTVRSLPVPDKGPVSPPAPEMTKLSPELPQKVEPQAGMADKKPYNEWNPEVKPVPFAGKYTAFYDDINHNIYVSEKGKVGPKVAPHEVGHHFESKLPENILDIFDDEAANKFGNPITQEVQFPRGESETIADLFARALTDRSSKNFPQTVNAMKSWIKEKNISYKISKKPALQPRSEATELGVSEVGKPASVPQAKAEAVKMGGHKAIPSEGLVDGDTYYTAYREPIKIGDEINLNFTGGPSDMPKPWKLVKAENKHSTVDYKSHPSITIEASNGNRMDFDFAEQYSPSGKNGDYYFDEYLKNPTGEPVSISPKMTTEKLPAQPQTGQIAGKVEPTVPVKSAESKPSGVTPQVQNAVADIVEGKAESKLGTKEFKVKMLAELDKAIKTAPDYDYLPETIKDNKFGEKRISIDSQIEDATNKIANLKEEIKDNNIRAKKQDKENAKYYNNQIIEDTKSLKATEIILSGLQKKKLTASPDKITVQIPGDGEFTVNNDKASLIVLKDKVSKLSEPTKSDKTFYGYNENLNLKSNPERGGGSGSLKEALASGEVTFEPAKKPTPRNTEAGSLSEVRAKHGKEVATKNIKKSQAGFIRIGKADEPNYSDILKKSNPEVGEFFDRTNKYPTGTSPKSIADHIKEKFIPDYRLKQGNDRAYFADAVEKIRQIKTSDRQAKAQAVNDLHGILQDLTGKQGDLFRRAVFADDLIWTGKQEMKLPEGLTVAKLEKYRADIEPLLSKDSAVRDAISRWREYSKAIRQDLIRREKLSADEAGNPVYVPHKILDYLSLKQGRGLEGSKIRTPRRGYTKSREGSLRDISTDYIAVMFEHMAQVAKDNIIEDRLTDIAKRYDISGKIGKGKPLPENYGYWSPRSGQIFKPGPNKPIEAALGDLMTAFDAEIPATKTAPEGKPFVLRKELIESLESAKKPYSPGLLAPAVRTWKRYILNVNPIRYNRRNFIGDIERLLAVDTGAFKSVLDAIRDIKDALRGKESPDFRLAVEKGVIGSGKYGIETAKLRNLPEFSAFKIDANIFHRGRAAISTAWDKMQELTGAREDLLRLTKFYADLKRIRSGQKINPGISNIQGLTDPIDAAAKVSRETLGDYGNFTSWEEGLRNGMAPFYSWLKINTTFWPKALVSTEGGAKAALALKLGRGTFRVAKVVGLIHGAVYLYNRLQHGDQEDRLPEWQKSQFHINTGLQSKDGKDIIITDPTALDDFLNTFGLSNISGDVYDLLRERTDLKSMMKLRGIEMAKGPVNAAVQRLNPAISTGTQIFLGRTTYPDIFNPGYVDQDNKILNTLGSIGGKEVTSLAKGNLGAVAKSYNPIPFKEISGVSKLYDEIGREKSRFLSLGTKSAKLIRLEAAANELSKLNSTIKLISKNEKINPDERRRRIETLKQRREKIAHDAVYGK